MTKKIIAMLVMIAMLVPFSSAVAADNTTVTPTIEEILNDYHSKAFEAQTTQEEAGTYSRSASGTDKTLEQETVEELTSAGYEAYNVTGENFDSLEDSLQTDLEAMGLSRDSSYIVVIHGESGNADGNPNARVIDPPMEEDFGGPTGTGFFYQHGGKAIPCDILPQHHVTMAVICMNIQRPLLHTRNSVVFGLIFLMPSFQLRFLPWYRVTL